jgi:hypothetical protein
MDLKDAMRRLALDFCCAFSPEVGAGLVAYSEDEPPRVARITYTRECKYYSAYSFE